MPKSSRPRGAAQSRLDHFLSPRPVSGARPARDRPARNDASRVGTVSSETRRVSRGSAFASCPVCGAEVAVRLMNDHLDGPRCGAPTPPTRPRPAPAPSLPGHFLIPDFITEAEEAELLAFVDGGEATNPWRPSTFNGKHRGKRWGVEVDLRLREVRPARRPMPRVLLALAERMRSEASGTCAALSEFRPNEANAIEYDRAAGSVLLPHVDDRQMSSDLIVNLSLGGACVMTYVGRGRGREGTEVDVRLPRRSLQVQSGATRYDFAHSIRNENLEDSRRVSVTFRQSATPKTRVFPRGT